MFKNILFRVIHSLKNFLPVLLFQDKRLELPNKKELELIHELKVTFQEIPPPTSEGGSETELSWFNNRVRLRKMVFEGDPRKFLRWDVIQTTMFSNKLFHYRLLNYLKSKKDWNTVWRRAVEERTTGHPTPFFLYPKSSGATIQHAYHCSKFSEKTSIKMSEIDFIFEFGGGYGSLCRIAHTLNFKGKYILFDLPEFSALQAFYLKSENLPVVADTHFSKTAQGITCISDLNILRNLLTRASMERSLFIATWSLSEAPLSLREMILKLISSFDLFLFTYQHNFNHIDNIKFFHEMVQGFPAVKWYHWEMEYIKNNYYLIGKKSYEQKKDT